MVGSLDQEIPHPQHRKTGFHESEQLLIEHQEFAKRELSKRLPPQTQTGRGRTPSPQPKDEEALALQFGPDEVFFLSLNLSIEGRAIRTGHSVSKYRHGKTCTNVGRITGILEPVRH